MDTTEQNALRYRALRACLALSDEMHDKIEKMMPSSDDDLPETPEALDQYADELIAALAKLGIPS